jgi:hypothetical protein
MAELGGHLASGAAIKAAPMRARERAWRNPQHPVHERIRASRLGAFARVQLAKSRKD